MLNSALNNLSSSGEWSDNGINYKAFDTKTSSNGNYGRIVISSDGNFEIYQMNGSTWNKTNSVITKRCFPDYASGIRLAAESTNKNMKVSQFGYLRASSWASRDAEPNIQLWIDNSLLLDTKDTKTHNGLMYPVSPGQNIDFYVYQGTGDLWFFPCKD